MSFKEASSLIQLHHPLTIWHSRRQAVRPEQGHIGQGMLFSQIIGDDLSIVNVIHISSAAASPQCAQRPPGIGVLRPLPGRPAVWALSPYR